MWEGNQNQSVQELLDIIKTESVRGGMNGNLSYLMPAFTALLVKLSTAADKRAKIIVRLTAILTILTLILTILTFVLAWKAWKSTS